MNEPRHVVDSPASTPAILCEDLVVGYGSLIAVDGLSLSVRKGECFGLVGPNGAGKTSTVEVFEGLLRPRSGKVEVLGECWGRGSASDRRLRERMGVALQETQLPEKLTVHELVRLFRSFYRRGRDPDELIAMLGLSEKRDARSGKLSGGQRQRLAVACALVGSPELLFLDEPTTGLDPSARRDIWGHLDVFVRQGGTVLLTTHYMEEAERLCGRVAVMDRGKLAALDTPAALVGMLGAGEIVEIETEGGFPSEAVATLPGVREVRRRAGRHAVYVDDAARALPAVLAALKDRGAAVRSSSTHRANLEDVFIHLTGREFKEEGGGEAA